MHGRSQAARAPRVTWTGLLQGIGLAIAGMALSALVTEGMARVLRLFGVDL
jgi:hypothetical protein